MQELGSVLASWLIQQEILEDAAGVSLEAKWVNRGTDPSYRGSRPSLGSMPEILAVRSTNAPGTQPGVGVRRGLSDAPTSVGPVVTTSIHPVKRRFLLPAVVALGLAAALLLWLRREPSGDDETAGNGASASAVVAPVAAPPPAAEPEPAEPARPQPAAASPEPEAPAPSAASAVLAPPPKAVSRKAARPAPPAKPEKPGTPATKVNDLMSPY
jgi:hypothetical protein